VQKESLLRPYIRFLREILAALDSSSRAFGDDSFSPFSSFRSPPSQLGFFSLLSYGVIVPRILP